MIQPTVVLDHAERAHLHAIATTEGYRILHRLMRGEVDKFVLALINADAADEKDVIARHKIAKSAAQFYEQWTQRVNEEVMQYTQATTVSDTPVDVTEGVIDIGDVADQLPNFNLLGGDDLE